MYLISPHKKQYKANLHCHSTLSDGKKTPKELKEMYKSHGYSILAITDHEVPKNHSYLNDEEFLTITGYEVYIRPDENGRYNVYDKETHINLFARDPLNEAIVCYNPHYCKYLSEVEKSQLAKVGSQENRRHTVDYINMLVRTAKENGYIASYNHPWWSMEAEESILSYDGFFSMEMCNYSSYLISHLEYNASLYDKMLLRGKNIFCHSSDDNHNDYPEGSPYCDSFGAFTMIMPEEFSYESVFQAMEKGDMYSSIGPVFNEVSLMGNKIHIECSDVQEIRVFTGSKSPLRKFAEEGETINYANFEIDNRVGFIRVSIVDKDGKFADTRGYMRNELGF